MDLMYLHMLQEWRASLPSAVEAFFLGLSYIGNGPALVALVLIVYWCANKHEGQRAIAALALGIYANQLIKNIACIYRPWIRDPTIIPAPAAIPGAGGYSFPSGHTTGTASALGSLAWQERRHRRWVVAGGVAITALMMFARNYLGVHTPQDVVVGLLVAVAAVAGSQLLYHWIEQREVSEANEATEDNKASEQRVSFDVVVLAAVLIIAVVSVAYVSLKSYPLDYIDGVLLVDPEEMREGAFEGAGFFVGWTLGWFLERRYVGFSTEGLSRRARLIRCGIGVTLVGCTYLATSLFSFVLPHNPAELAQMATVSLIAAFAVPKVFSAYETYEARHV